MDLGKRFKRFREKCGLTQSEAAERIGIKNYQLGNYETNRSEPSISILKKMSEVYEVSVDSLIGNFRFANNEHVLNDSVDGDITDLAEQLKKISEELKEMSK